MSVAQITDSPAVFQEAFNEVDPDKFSPDALESIFLYYKQLFASCNQKDGGVDVLEATLKWEEYENMKEAKARNRPGDVYQKTGSSVVVRRVEE